MNYAVLYSSRTGNTKQIAEAIWSVLPEETPCLPVEKASQDLSQYGCVFLGFWVDRGTADAAAQAVLQRLTSDHIALFATLGADPTSEHAAKSMKNAAELLQRPQNLVHTFICQGKVDPQLIAQMKKMFPAGHPHGPSQERDARHQRAATHPDSADCDAAKAFARETMRRIGGK